ncbi:MAG TPA: phosphoribosylanthranilate isomerase [Gemmatimonadaceae bacterium]|nr:phosphoribosylanthranilate isomerase [Gemmatimonadaceae bacterium]
MQSAEEALLAIEHGVSAIGLVSAMPSGPGPIPEELIPEIAAAVPPGIETFLLTCLTDPAEIVAQHRRCGTTTIQLVDAVDHWTFAQLRDELPGVSLVQVIHVSGSRSVDEATDVAPHVDAILLDSGNPSLNIKELGGTGRMHDWNVSRTIRDTIDVPVWLAGGLKPENVARAVDIVEPFGVDVCSGLRPNGHLDPWRLQQFMDALRA